MVSRGLLYDKESRINAKKEDGKIKASEMKLLKGKGSCTRKYLIRYEEVGNSLNVVVYSIIDGIVEYKKSGIQ